MCGRYALMSAAELVAELFGLAEVTALAPRYNIAPTQEAPVVRLAKDGRSRRLDQLHWGLVPWWAKDPSIGSRMINARSETVAERAGFRRAMERRRCLVPADGFFEWKKDARGKQPYFIRRADGTPCAFAGLWERWRDDDDNPLDSFTILTTRPNDLVAPLHDRMPVILDPSDFDRWLDFEQQDAAALTHLLGPLPASQCTSYPVSRAVNRPAHDMPDCVEPAPPDEDEGDDADVQPTLFSE